MSGPPGAAARLPYAAPLAPFAVRSFRFQWPADILTSWAFEMETLILGWFVLVETESVFLLTLFGSLQLLGTLLAPFFGVAGDRLGRRRMLCGMRAFYAAMAGLIMTLGLLEALRPVHVFPIAFMIGLVRPSDLVMRNSLIGDTMPADSLMSALGLARMTMDTARIVGALVGAGLFAALGIGPAYMFVATFYALSFALTLGVSRVHPAGDAEAAAGGMPPSGAWASRWRDLRDGLAYVWNTPNVLAVLWLAFLVNLTAFPFTHGLLPFVAREIYAIDETGLSHLVASFAGGALTGSVFLAVTGRRRRSARFMVIAMVLWYALLATVTQMQSKPAGATALFVMGFFQSLTMVSMSGVLLRAVSERFRARVMGIRMLAVYGLPLGLITSGPLIDRLGFAATGALYVTLGLAGVAAIGLRWRRFLWRRTAGPSAVE